MTLSISYREVETDLSSNFSSKKSGFCLIIAGKKMTYDQLFVGEAVSLGRNTATEKHNQIECSNGSVSRQHAQITIKAEGVFEIMDCGSKYGTTLNRVQLQVGIPYPLKHGDEVKLGYGPKIIFSTAKSKIEILTRLARNVKELLSAQEIFRTR